MSIRRRRDNCISKWALLPLFVFGAVPLTFYVWHAYAVRQAQQWPTVAATVVRSQLTSSTNLVESLRGSEAVRKDKLEFEFAYKVSGRDHISRRFYVVGHAPPHNVVQAFPVGWQFSARYNPVSPEIAVVEPGPLYGRVLVGSLICLALAAMGVVYNSRQTR